MIFKISNYYFYHKFEYGLFLTPSTAKDRQPVKSLVLGRPILLALEDIDGTPSFLEKALRFMEEHGNVLSLQDYTR